MVSSAIACTSCGAAIRCRRSTRLADANPAAGVGQAVVERSEVVLCPRQHRGRLHARGELWVEQAVDELARSPRLAFGLPDLPVAELGDREQRVRGCPHRCPRRDAVQRVACPAGARIPVGAEEGGVGEVDVQLDRLARAVADLGQPRQRELLRLLVIAEQMLDDAPWRTALVRSAEAVSGSSSRSRRNSALDSTNSPASPRGIAWPSSSRCRAPRARGRAATARALPGTSARRSLAPAWPPPARPARAARSSRCCSAGRSARRDGRARSGGRRARRAPPPPVRAR